MAQLRVTVAKTPYMGTLGAVLTQTSLIQPPLRKRAPTDKNLENDRSRDKVSWRNGKTGAMFFANCWHLGPSLSFLT